MALPIAFPDRVVACLLCLRSGCGDLFGFHGGDEIQKALQVNQPHAFDATRLSQTDASNLRLVIIGRASKDQFV
jgi:hypothetical protein